MPPPARFLWWAAWIKRDGGNGDVFAYDDADQVTAAKLDIPNPDTTGAGSQTIIYDANGNRNWFTAYGPVEEYTTDEFNRYPSRKVTTDSSTTTTNARYDANSNMTTGLDGSSYAYDAQNRLTSATKSRTTDRYPTPRRIVNR